MNMTMNSLSGAEFKRKSKVGGSQRKNKMVVSGDQWLKELSTDQAKILLNLCDEKIESLRVRIENAKAKVNLEPPCTASMQPQPPPTESLKTYSFQFDSTVFDPRTTAFCHDWVDRNMPPFASPLPMFGYDCMELELINAPPCTVADPPSHNLEVIFPTPRNTTGDGHDHDGKRLSESNMFDELSAIFTKPKSYVSSGDEYFNADNDAKHLEPPFTENVASTDDIKSDNAAGMVDDFAFLDGIPLSPLSDSDFESMMGLDMDTFFNFEVEEAVP